MATYSAADRPCLICQSDSDPAELSNTSSMILDISSSGSHLQNAPKQPEAADLEVSSGWDTKFKSRGKTCLRIGADILAPEGSRHPRRA